MYQQYEILKGESSTLFERLSTYIWNYDNDWINRILPASKGDIERLMEISNFSKWIEHFPKDYYTFLKKMGANDGGLLSKALLGTAGIQYILNIYQDYEEETDDNIRQMNDQPYFVIFQQDMGAEFAMELLSSQDSGRIVNFDYGDSSAIISESFENLLFQCAFWNYSKYKHCYSLGSSVTDITDILAKTKKSNFLEIVEEIVRDFRMEKIWFSDCTNYMAFSNDVCFAIRISYVTRNTYTAVGFVSGDDLKIVKALSNAFVYNAGLCISPSLFY